MMPAKTLQQHLFERAYQADRATFAAEVAANCGLTPTQVDSMIDHGADWLHAELAKLQAALPSARRDLFLVAINAILAFLVRGKS